MNYKKVQSVVFDILEGCSCEDERICYKCPFMKICTDIFTGDLSIIPQPNEEKKES